MSSNMEIWKWDAAGTKTSVWWAADCDCVWCSIGSNPSFKIQVKISTLRKGRRFRNGNVTSSAQTDDSDEEWLWMRRLMVWVTLLKLQIIPKEKLQTKMWFHQIAQGDGGMTASWKISLLVHISLFHASCACMRYKLHKHYNLLYLFSRRWWSSASRLEMLTILLKEQPRLSFKGWEQEYVMDSFRH